MKSNIHLSEADLKDIKVFVSVEYIRVTMNVLGIFIQNKFKNLKNFISIVIWKDQLYSAWIWIIYSETLSDVLHKMFI